MLTSNYHFLRLILFLIISYFVICPLAYSKDIVVLNDTISDYPLGKHVEIFEDKGKNLTIDNIIKSGDTLGFKPSIDDVPNPGLTSSSIWVRFNLKNDSSRELWQIEIEIVPLDKIEFYAVDELNQIEVKKSGAAQPISLREVKHRFFIFDLKILHGQTKTFYLRAESHDAIALPMSIISQKVLNEKDYIRQYTLGIYYGVLTIMILYNLFIFIFLRDKSYLYYVLYFTCFLMVQSYDDGILFGSLWTELTGLGVRGDCVFIALTMVFGILFSKTFLHTSQYAPLLDKIIKITLYFLAVYIIIIMIVFSAVMLKIIILFALVVIPIIVGTGAICLYKGYKPARFYMLANISFLLGVGINLLADLSLLPMNFITSHGMQIGSGLDVALLSIALADRINILRQDKEKAEQETKLLNIQLEQKVIERTQELKESEEKFKAMFDYSNDGINFVDLETKEIILFNNRFQEMLGYSDSEISGMSIENIHPKQDWIWILEKFENAVQERILVIEDIPVLKKDGTVFFTDINSYSCESVKKPFLVGMFRDITERKQFADKLNQSVQYSLSIINSSMDMIIATDKAGSIFEFNISAQQLFQYRKDEIIGRNLSYLFLPLENSINIYDETIKRSSFYAETMCVCKDGREFVAAVSFSVMYAFDGEILGLVGVMRDITERKKMEMKQTQLFDELKAANEQLKNSQEQLVKSEKMAALGQLVTGVAHEINTPIGIALTSSSRLVTLSNNIQSSIENKTMKKSDFEQYLRDCVQGNDLIVRNLNRTADLIRSFKMVSADQTSQEIRKFNLRSYLKDIITSLGAKLKNTQHVIEIVSSEDIVLESNPGAIAQIITNLMMNSIIHGYEQGEKGHIVISCKAKNEVIILTYSDNGKGIPEENLKKIFDPFFTTKRGAGSTGLGLNIVFNLVDQSLKGTIRCESRVGQGRAGQGRAGQGRAGQGRAGQGRAGQGRAGQGTIFIIELPINLKKEIAMRPYKPMDLKDNAR